jgi:hypothetical protein
VPVRIFLQEVELALLEHHGQVGDSCARPERRRGALIHWYERAPRARLGRGVACWPRASRPEGTEALALLDQADTLDPDCVWVDYGRAWWRYRLRRFKEARDRSGWRSRRIRAPPTMRLLSTMHGGRGRRRGGGGGARDLARPDRRRSAVRGVDRADALLDLAALEVLRGEPKAALEHLEDSIRVPVRDPQRARKCGGRSTSGAWR